MNDPLTQGEWDQPVLQITSHLHAKLNAISDNRRRALYTGKPCQPSCVISRGSGQNDHVYVCVFLPERLTPNMLDQSRHQTTLN